MPFPEYLEPDVDPVAAEAAVITGPNCRFTVLTPRVLRLEYDPEETFEDRPSQLVWYRNQPVPDFEVSRDGHRIVIETDALRLEYTPTDAGFSPETLSIDVFENGTTWRYGDEPADNLGGGLRTLDRVRGSTDLEDGIIARDGWSVVDDADSLVFDDEWVTPRDASDGYEDLYFFGYGREYTTALADFTAITGNPPLLPRFALGNWWSRYREFSQEELRRLMETFAEKDLPLSVCMIDMDWHVIDNPYHGGWTGWTWNRDLFEDPPGFLGWLHDHDLRTGLNIHPADGIHPHEVQYDDFAEFLGIDPASEQAIGFDASDPQFLAGYFEHVVEPIEEIDGVDFWWIDWQQWTESPEMEGLDPLWALNHLHALDRERDGKRPFVLSRWPGLGGHRYPVGFSGDAVIDWDSLQFQPHLTAAGGNAAFGWWSHDIGGHFGNTGSLRTFGELFARWAQFGTFSPINRIHTGDIPYLEKRPWVFEPTIRETVSDAMRLRHRLVPYLYTMAWRYHESGVAPIRPMYYHHPDEEAAYHSPQEYYFGSELIAAPHVRERDDETNLARQTVWLPDGEWFDFVTGERYESGFHARYGDMDDLPIYAKGGAIVPMDGGPTRNSVDAPETLRVLAFPGGDNGFDLYEDDGETLAYRDGEFAITPLGLTWEDDWLAFEIDPVEGETEYVPDDRTYELCFRGIHGNVDVSVEGLDADPAITYETDTTTLIVELEGVTPEDDVSVYVDTDESTLLAGEDNTMDRLRDVLWYLDVPARSKQPIENHAAAVVSGERSDLEWLNDFAEVLSPPQVRAIVETICDVGVEHLDHTEDERILVWNGEGREDATLTLRTFDRGGIPMAESGDSRRGPLPAFEVFEPDEWWRQDWTLEIEYADITAAEFNGEGETELYEGM
ncbi:MAG: TIM-barrel domain-containing protein [Halorhabdus sp.]